MPGQLQKMLSESARRLIERFIFLGLASSLPGLAAAMWLNHILRASSNVLHWLQGFGYHPSLGRILGLEPYLYDIFGIYIGFILFILFRLLLPKGLVRRWIWEITLVVFGLAVYMVGDALLGISVLSLGPAVVVFEDLENRQNTRAAENAC